MWNDASIKFSQIRAVLKYRWGALWNTAQRMGMRYGPWAVANRDVPGTKPPVQT